MAISFNTIEGINTVFPISAYDPTNPTQINIVANWGDGSEERVLASRYKNRDREYYYEFNKTYEFPGTFTVIFSGARVSSTFAETVSQLASYVVTVDTFNPVEPLPVLKVVDISNYVGYKLFYFNVDDDGVPRSWTDRQIYIPVSFGTTVIGFLSASYNNTLSGTIGVSLTANQVINQNWPLKTNLPFEILEKDNTQDPPVVSTLLRGYMYVYEATTNSAIFL